MSAILAWCVSGEGPVTSETRDIRSFSQVEGGIDDAVVTMDADGGAHVVTPPGSGPARPTSPRGSSPILRVRADIAQW